MTYLQALKLIENIYQVYAKMHSRMAYPREIEMNYKLVHGLEAALRGESERSGLYHLVSDPYFKRQNTLLGMPLITCLEEGIRVVGDKEIREVQLPPEIKDEN